MFNMHRQTYFPITEFLPTASDMYTETSRLVLMAFLSFVIFVSRVVVDYGNDCHHLFNLF